MNQAAPYYITVILILSTITSLILSILSCQHWKLPGGTAFTALVSGATLWAFFALCQSISPGFSEKLLFVKLEQLGVCAIPLAWVAFSVQYTYHSRWLTRRNFFILAFFPVLTLAAVMTNEWHHLFWSQITPLVTDYGIQLHFVEGPWFWAFSLYAYINIIAGILILLWSLLQLPSGYRRQPVILLLGICIPFVLNFFYLSNALDGQANFDPTPVAFTVGAVVIFWDIYRFRLFGLAPIAYDAVTDSLIDGLLVIDTENRVVAINPACCKILRIDPDWKALIGLPIYKIFPQLAEVTQPLAQDAVVHTEIVQLNQHPAYFDVRVTPIFSQSRHYLGRSILIREVTNKKENEERLKLLSAAVSAAANGIAITHIDGSFIWANPAFTRITGYSLEEIIGQNPRILQSGQHDTTFYQKLWETITSGRVWNGEIINRRKTGEIYYEDQTITPVLDDKGRIISFVGIKQDITARKNAEAAERDQLNFMEALAEVAADLNSTLVREEVLERVINTVGRVVKYDGVNILMIKGGGSEAVTVKERGYLEKGLCVPSAVFGELVEEIETIPTWAEMLRTHQPLIIKDTRTADNWLENGKTTGIRSFLGAPILIQNQVVGFINLDSTEPAAFTEVQASRLRAFAGYVAIALENTRLYEKSLLLQSQLFEQSIRDPLTGVFNRRYMAETLDRELSRAKREKLPLSVVSIDIDQFKRINDTFGHPMGDEMIKALANILCKNTRESDIVCRWGGEEFTVVLPGMDLMIALERAEEWRKAYANFQLPLDEQVVTTTISVGIAAFPENGDTCDKVLLAADQALYDAKNQGRNRVVVTAVRGQQQIV